MKQIGVARDPKCWLSLIAATIGAIIVTAALFFGIVAASIELVAAIFGEGGGWILAFMAPMFLPSIAGLSLAGGIFAGVLLYKRLRRKPDAKEATN
jgi:hypothetical protein